MQPRGRRFCGSVPASPRIAARPSARSAPPTGVTLPLCVFTTGCPPPPNAQGLDKPWLAIDGTHGRFGGSAYLVWVHDYADGRHQLRFSALRDRGHTYSAPIVLDRPTATRLEGLEELAQLAVRPDGTVDVVWNAVRHGRPVILHAVSTEARELPHTEADRLAEARSQPLRNRDDPRRLTSRSHGHLLVAGEVAKPLRPPGRVQDHRPLRVVEPCAPHSAGGRLAGVSPRSGVPGRTALGRRIRSDATSTRLVAVGARLHGFGRPYHGEPVAGARVTHLRSPRARMSRHGDVHRRLHRARRDPTPGRHRLHRAIAESLPARTGWSSHRCGRGMTTLALCESPSSGGPGRSEAEAARSNRAGRSLADGCRGCKVIGWAATTRRTGAGSGIQSVLAWARGRRGVGARAGRGAGRERAPLYRWFPDGRLNMCFNLLDRHVRDGRGDQAALIYDSPVTGQVRTYTYRELLDETARVAGAFARLGVGGAIGWSSTCRWCQRRSWR